MPIQDFSIEDFTPPFCPNPNCSNHKHAQDQWFYCDGYHYSKCRGDIPRFKCKICKKTCSSQTFSIHYWTHSTMDMEQLDKRMQSCAGQRQLAREYGVTHNVIANRQNRLARNYLTCFDAVFNEASIEEDCCFDGFESYIVNQYHPSHFNILIGKYSQMPYGFTMGMIRRKGKMTPKQKERREQIDAVWKQPRGHYGKEITRLFKDFEHHVPIQDQQKPWTLVTDMARSYPAAIKRVPLLKRALEQGRMVHIRVSSKKPRTVNNELFSSNYIDRELRKNQAEHVRETVRHGREVHMSLNRMVIGLGYHAFKKPYRIGNKVDTSAEPTHADVAGVMKSVKQGNCFKTLYSGRHVKSHLKGTMEWIGRIWGREYENPPIVDFKAEKIKEGWQPGTGYVAHHLLV